MRRVGLPGGVYLRIDSPIKSLLDLLSVSKSGKLVVCHMPVRNHSERPRSLHKLVWLRTRFSKHPNFVIQDFPEAASPIAFRKW